MGWKSHRAKEPLAVAMKNLRQAENYLQRFYAYVNDTHPEMGDCAIQASYGIELILQMLLSLWRESWRHFPKDLQEYIGATEDCELL